MLRLLLDEHISPVVARELRLKEPGLFVTSVQEWEAGVHIGLRDEELLPLAQAQGLTLVTYDQRTIAPLLKSWAEDGTMHGGVLFVDEKTVAPNDFGGLVRGLATIWKQFGQQDWTDWVLYLTAAR